MTISARKIIAVLSVLALIAAWYGWGYWLHWSLTDPMADNKDNFFALAMLALPLLVATALCAAFIWEENPTITIGRKSSIPQATANERDGDK